MRIWIYLLQVKKKSWVVLLQSTLTYLFGTILCCTHFHNKLLKTELRGTYEETHLGPWMQEGLWHISNLGCVTYLVVCHWRCPAISSVDSSHLINLNDAVECQLGDRYHCQNITNLMKLLQLWSTSSYTRAADWQVGMAIWLSSFTFLQCVLYHFACIFLMKL